MSAIQSIAELLNPNLRPLWRTVRVIAYIEEKAIIDTILAHLREKELMAPAPPLLLPLPAIASIA